MTKHPDGTVTLSKDEARHYDFLRVGAFLGSNTPEGRSGECDDPTWRGWLRACFLAVLSEGEGFSGKRPLGNSGWQMDLSDALEAHKVHLQDVLDVLFGVGAKRAEDEVVEADDSEPNPL